MEKCGQLWRPGGQVIQRNALQGGVYSINRAAAMVEMRACSACAGDYEDSDRTAWAPDDEEEDKPDSAGRRTTDEFPAEDGADG